MTTDEPGRAAERVLYGVWLSPYMAMVAHLLLEAGLPFRYERVSPFLGDTQADRHRARNPLGKIPSLEEPDGTVVSESQAICRYLSRIYPEARSFYPCDDPVRCAGVDAINDFITFSISGPFFTWFVVGAYFPRAWELETRHESRVFGACSMVMIRSALARMFGSGRTSPFLLGSQPLLPDFQLFHILELGRTFSGIFEMPPLDLTRRDGALQEFHAAMAARPSTREILAAQQDELPVTRREIFSDFKQANQEMLKTARPVLQALFGHPV